MREFFRINLFSFLSFGRGLTLLRVVSKYSQKSLLQCIETGSWKECIIAVGVIKGICDERLWETHEKSIGTIQTGSKRRRTNNARVEIENNLALVNIEEQQRLWNEAKGNFYVILRNCT